MVITNLEHALAILLGRTSLNLEPVSSCQTRPAAQCSLARTAVGRSGVSAWQEDTKTPACLPPPAWPSGSAHIVPKFAIISVALVETIEFVLVDDGGWARQHADFFIPTAPIRDIEPT